MVEKQELKRRLTDEEIKRLAQYMDVLIQIDQREKVLEAQLKDTPKGFALKGDGRNCSLCRNHVYDDGWFDKWGFKCLNCQDAVNKSKIPGSLCRDYSHERSIPDTALAIDLGVKVQTIRKLIREGKIVGRKIPNGPYMVLRKDNPTLSHTLNRELSEHLQKNHG